MWHGTTLFKTCYVHLESNPRLMAVGKFMVFKYNRPVHGHVFLLISIELITIFIGHLHRVPNLNNFHRSPIV